MVPPNSLSSSELDRLLPLVYDELRAVAGKALGGEPSGHTLQPTALVHEAYLRLVRQRERAIKNRAQFFALAARVIRRVLVDHARLRLAMKRGDGNTRIPLEDHLALQDEPMLDSLALHEALEKLAKDDMELSRLVELRFFAGLTLEECAAAMDQSRSNIHRRWEFARTWLKRELSQRDA